MNKRISLLLVTVSLLLITGCDNIDQDFSRDYTRIESKTQSSYQKDKGIATYTISDGYSGTIRIVLSEKFGEAGDKIKFADDGKICTSKK